MTSFIKRLHTLVVGIAITLITFGVALAQEDVHWSYEGDTGPEHWGSLSPDFAMCAQGREQSPVDIPSNAPLNPDNISFSYRPSALTLFNNGHTIQANYDPGSSLTLNGVRYDLLQFHFHTASEHAIGGKHEPMEIHFVHRNAQGGLAVVGVLLKAGGEHAAYAPIFQSLPPQASQPAPVAGATVDANQLLPSQHTYWRYNGSLTTPPCTEGVTWLVMNTPIELSDAQIGAFTSIFPNDERPVQPLNGRSFLVPASWPQTGARAFVLEGVLIGVGVLMLVTGLAFAYVGRRCHSQQYGHD
jgi:carbonic anhydrase